MKYTGKYYRMLALFMKKYLKEQYGKNITKKALQKAPYYHFTRCPLNDFARKYGFLEVLPICCDMDYITTEYSHGILHRDYTLASGGDI